MRAEKVALAHQEIERSPQGGHEIESGAHRDRARRDAAVGTAGADRLRDVRTGGTHRPGCKFLGRRVRLLQQREQQQLGASAFRPLRHHVGDASLQAQITGSLGGGKEIHRITTAAAAAAIAQAALSSRTTGRQLHQA